MRIHGISRRRLGTDGRGVTDLVAMAGCSLACTYCLNGRLLAEGSTIEITAGDLLASVMQEACYFVGTGGGVTFGGGEPLLQGEGIKEFAALRPEWMSLSIETALQVPQDVVDALIPTVDLWIVDIKSLDQDVYRGYAHGSLSVALRNLEALMGVKEKVLVRVPIIPGYKDEQTARAEAEALVKMGFERIDVFPYVVR